MQPFQGIAVSSNPAVEPVLRSLYITREGMQLLKQQERLLVVNGKDVEARLPLRKIDHIVLQGNQTVSTALLQYAASNDIHVSIADDHGNHRLGLVNPGSTTLVMLRQQFLREQDDAFGIAIVRELIASKLHNCRALLRQHNRRRNIPTVEQAGARLGQLQGMLAHRSELNVLRGFEGSAARAHFAAIAALLPSHWQFRGRQRQPPGDPCNVLLSYGYQVLYATVEAMIQQRGLHAGLGHLHVADGRHAALASDLMEEFRAPMVDAVALNALMNEFSPDDFAFSDDPVRPCRMHDATRRRYLEMLQQKFRSQITHPQTGQLVDYQRLVQAQVWHYARVIKGDDPAYRGFRLR